MAITAELKSLKEAKTWDVVKYPNRANIISCKWVFKIKQNTVKEINKYKAWLVVKGYSQVQGVDYNETYAPVVWLTSLRMILAMTAYNNWGVEVFNFHSAFLNGKLNNGEDIYMELPAGYNTTGNYRQPITKLQVAPYGSKQGVLKWYIELYKYLGKLELKRAKSNWGIFCQEVMAFQSKPGGT